MNRGCLFSCQAKDKFQRIDQADDYILQIYTGCLRCSREKNEQDLVPYLKTFESI